MLVIATFRQTWVGENGRNLPAALTESLTLANVWPHVRLCGNGILGCALSGHARRARSDERHDRPSRARRGRALSQPRASSRCPAPPGRARPPAAGDPRPHRAGASAVRRRPRAVLDRLQRRGLQLPRAARGSCRPPPAVSLADHLRHRGPASGVRAIRRAVHLPIQRHVRLRHLGPDPRKPLPGPRPDGPEASLLRAGARRPGHRLRQRTGGAALRALGRSEHRSRGADELSVLGICSFAPHNLQGRQQAPASAPDAHQRIGSQDKSILPTQRAAGTRRPSPFADGAGHHDARAGEQRGQTPARGGCASGVLSVRRDRLLDHRRGHAGERSQGSAGAHVFHRLRRSALR